MLRVITPKDMTFNYTECEELYNEYKELIGDDDFKDVINRTRFYAFYISKTMELIGCIYYYEIGRKLFVNAFANRHHHELNLECLKESMRWFKRNIYAKTNHKTAILCLLKCGFKKENNLYVHRR